MRARKKTSLFNSIMRVVLRFLFIVWVFAYFLFVFAAPFAALYVLGLSFSTSVTGNGEVNKNAQGIGSIGNGSVDENCFKGVCIEVKGEGDE